MKNKVTIVIIIIIALVSLGLKQGFPRLAIFPEPNQDAAISELEKFAKNHDVVCFQILAKTIPTSSYTYHGYDVAVDKIVGWKLIVLYK